jgi:tetratricopeptide (TPR) repeat protein
VQLKVTLLGAVPKVRTTDPQAYALFLQAAQVSHQSTAEAFAQSDSLYRQALAIDPRYAPAWSGLAGNSINETTLGLVANEEGFAGARDEIEKALASDSEYALAHSKLGYLAITADNDAAAAARHFERALALDPANLSALVNAALLLQDLGRLDEALAVKEAVVRRDPVNVQTLEGLGDVQLLSGRFDPAIASYRTVLSLSPGASVISYGISTALLLQGDAAAALDAIGKETSDPYRMIGLPMVYHALGRTADSDRALAELIAKYENDAPYNIAYVCAFRGEPDEAFEWLDKAVQYEDPGLSDIVVENLFENIRSDPRWLPFLRRIGKDPETLAKVEFKVTLPKEWQDEAAAAEGVAQRQ